MSGTVVIHTWVLWLALVAFSVPSMITLAMRVYFRWRWARALVARGEALDKLAAVWGLQRMAVRARFGGLRSETDQELRVRIREESSV